MHQQKWWVSGLVSVSGSYELSEGGDCDPQSLQKCLAPWSRLGQGYKPYRALWLGQGEDEGAGEWAAPFKERAVGKELWEPAGHLFLNDRGSQELLAPPSSIHPAPITFLSLSGYLEPPAR